MRDKLVKNWICHACGGGGRWVTLTFQVSQGWEGWCFSCFAMRHYEADKLCVFTDAAQPIWAFCLPGSLPHWMTSHQQNFFSHHLELLWILTNLLWTFFSYHSLWSLRFLFLFCLFKKSFFITIFILLRFLIFNFILFPIPFLSPLSPLF